MIKGLRILYGEDMEFFIGVAVEDDQFFVVHTLNFNDILVYHIDLHLLMKLCVNDVPIYDCILHSKQLYIIPNEIVSCDFNGKKIDVAGKEVNFEELPHQDLPKKGAFLRIS